MNHACTGARNDPYSAFNFIVEIDGVTVAGFAECSGLDNETDRSSTATATETHHVASCRACEVPEHRPQARVHRQPDLWEWRKTVDRRQDRAAVRHDRAAQRGPRAGAAVELPRGLAVEVGRARANAKNNEVAIETLEIGHEGLELE